MKHPRALILWTFIAAGCEKPAGKLEGMTAEPPPLPNMNEPMEEDPMMEEVPPGCVGSFPEGCRANCASPSEERQYCNCEISDCDATSAQCECDPICFPDQNGTVPQECLDDLEEALGDCASQLECEEYNDLSTFQNCSVKDCPLVNPVEVVVDPTAPSVDPNSPSVSPEQQPQSSPVTQNANRQPAQVDVLFVVDNSASMGDDQAAGACAIESFFGAVDAGGGMFRAAVLTSDLLGDDPTGSTNTVSSSYPCRHLGTNNVDCDTAPGLVGIQGACSASVPCSCPLPASLNENLVCNFNDQGAWIDSADPAGREILKQLIVQGEWGSWYEGGLEAAFQYFAGLERSGQFDSATPTQIVIIADEDADGQGSSQTAPEPDGRLLCPFNSVSRNLTGLPNFNPPAPSNGTTVAACKQDLINFYSAYFTSRGITVHGLTYTSACNSNNTEAIGAVYNGVIQATGGQITPICLCQQYDPFFTAVGQETAELSTRICLDGVPAPGTLEVTYTEGGATQPVPESATDGWTYDPSSNCIVLNGSWVSRFGSYRLDYFDQNAPPTDPVSIGCLSPNGPVPDPLELSCNGTDVPQSSTDGYTYDPSTRCFTFRGSWAESTACTTFEINPTACGLGISDPRVTEIFCGQEKVPESNTDGWNPIPDFADCIGLHGSWADRACTFTSTPKICPEISGPAPVPDTLGLTCDGAEVPESYSDGWVYDSASRCFYVYGSWATATCQWAVSYLPSNNGP